MKIHHDYLNYYVTAWGQFQMPAGLAEKTKWRYFKADFLQGKHVVKEPEPTPDNHEFFSWLHKQEVGAGKPEQYEVGVCENCGASPEGTPPCKRCPIPD